MLDHIIATLCNGWYKFIRQYIEIIQDHTIGKTSLRNKFSFIMMLTLYVQYTES